MPKIKCIKVWMQNNNDDDIDDDNDNNVFVYSQE